MTITLEQLAELLEVLCEQATSIRNIGRTDKKWKIEHRIYIQDHMRGQPTIWLGKGIPKEPEYHPAVFIEVFMNDVLLFKNTILYKKTENGNFVLDEESKKWLIEAFLLNLFNAALEHTWNLHQTHLKQQKFM